MASTKTAFALFVFFNCGRRVIDGMAFGSSLEERNVTWDWTG
jgi:hypothetical protein